MLSYSVATSCFQTMCGVSRPYADDRARYSFILVTGRHRHSVNIDVFGCINIPDVTYLRNVHLRILANSVGAACCLDVSVVIRFVCGRLCCYCLCSAPLCSLRFE